MTLPIPFLGLFRLGRRAGAVFPATRAISIMSIVLGILPLLFGVAAVVNLIWTADSPYAWLYLGGGFLLMYASMGLEWFWFRRVRIVRIGMSSLEVRFASQEYAEEFCRLNEFGCHSRPTPKRAMPITVNDVR